MDRVIFYQPLALVELPNPPNTAGWTPELSFSFSVPFPVTSQQFFVEGLKITAPPLITSGGFRASFDIAFKAPLGAPFHQYDPGAINKLTTTAGNTFARPWIPFDVAINTPLSPANQVFSALGLPVEQTASATGQVIDQPMEAPPTVIVTIGSFSTSLGQVSATIPPPPPTPGVPPQPPYAFSSPFPAVLKRFHMVSA